MSDYGGGGGSGGGRDSLYGRPMRSKGLLPAIGVGAAVYIVTGFASLGTLGLVGIGAGVGYGVGSWIADKYQKKHDAVRGSSAEQLPWAVEVALQQWQDFVAVRSAGRQLSQADIDRIWQEFEQTEPTHAANARAVVRGVGASSSRAGCGASPMPGGPMIVPTSAAEV